jgi:hypothetical protein
VTSQSLSNAADLATFQIPMWSSESRILLCIKSVSCPKTYYQTFCQKADKTYLLYLRTQFITQYIFCQYFLTTYYAIIVLTNKIRIYKYAKYSRKFTEKPRAP